MRSANKTRNDAECLNEEVIRSVATKTEGLANYKTGQNTSERNIRAYNLPMNEQNEVKVLEKS